SLGNAHLVRFLKPPCRKPLHRCRIRLALDCISDCTPIDVRLPRNYIRDMGHDHANIRMGFAPCVRCFGLLVRGHVLPTQWPNVQAIPRSALSNRTPEFARDRLAVYISQFHHVHPVKYETEWSRPRLHDIARSTRMAARSACHRLVICDSESLGLSSICTSPSVNTSSS